MKVICINAGFIELQNVASRGSNLIQGKIYTAIDEYKDDNGSEVYLIEELLNEIRLDGYPNGQKLKCRFRIIDTDWVDEAIEKALNNEEELITI